jgi:hypothetical protein
MTSIFVVLAGFLIRIAIPLLLMLALVYLLRRLDARWQMEALYRQKLDADETQEHTWELKDCSIEGALQWPALQSSQHCWQVLRKSNGTIHEECLRCKVFRAAPILLPG